MQLSLIVGTLGRESELRRLLTSLAAQTFRDFEVLLIDQTGNDTLLPLLAEYETSVPLRRITAGRGLSKSRNLGLSLATGDLVAFPDDDAWYPTPTLLEEVADAFQCDETLDGLSFRVTDEAGLCSAGGWMSTAQVTMTPANIWRTAVSCSFFLRRSALGDLRFDEALGVGAGTPYGSGEETDFLLRLLERGATLRYDGTRTVGHHSAPFASLESGGEVELLGREGAEECAGTSEDALAVGTARDDVDGAPHCV